MSDIRATLDSRAKQDDFDLASMIDVLILYRRMIATIFTLIVCCGLCYAVLADPPYQADILVQLEDTNPASAARSMLGDLGSMFDVQSNAETESYVIGSRLVVARAVAETKLYISASPARIPLLGDAIARNAHSLSRPGLFGFGGYTWGNERIAVNVFDVPSEFEESRYTLTLLGYNKYSLRGSGLSAGAIGDVGKFATFQTEFGPISLDVASVSGNPGASFELIRYPHLTTIDALQRSLKITQEGKDTDVLRVKLRGIDPVRITDTMNQIADAYVDQNIARKSADAERSLAFLEKQLPDLRMKLDASEATLTDLRGKLNSVSIEGEAKLVLDQSAQFDAQILQLRQQRTELVSRFSDTYPAVRALDQQIAILNGRTASLNQRINGLPDVQRQIVRAERDVKLNNEMYVGVLNNVEQLRLLRAGQIGNVRVIDRAVVPVRPVRLWRVWVVGISFFLGIFCATALAFLRDSFFGGLNDAQDIEDRTKLKVFSTIPLGRGSKRFWARLRNRNSSQRFLALASPDEPAVEALRSLRTAVNFSMLDTRNNIVMFTGPAPNIGKSFVSANFAVVLAASGKRVLLVDADLRRGHLGEWYAGGAKPGLTDVIEQRAALDQAIRRTQEPNLHIMPCGKRPKNAADMLDSDAMRVLFQELSNRYDVVIIDSGPVLQVSDALHLAPYAVGNVFVVARAAATKLGELEETKRRLMQVDVDVTGVILNGVDPRTGRLRFGAKYGVYRYTSHDYSNARQDDASSGA